MPEFLSLVFGLVRVGLRRRADLVTENVLLRQRLAVLARPSRERPRLGTRDKVLRLLVRAVRRDWRRHLLPVRPETVVGWRRQGWRLCWGGRCATQLLTPNLSETPISFLGSPLRRPPEAGADRVLAIPRPREAPVHRRQPGRVVRSLGAGHAAGP